MITVRFPSGLAVTYNSGWYIRQENEGLAIRDKDPSLPASRLIAMIQPGSGAMIEWVAPCRVEMQTKPPDLEQLAKEIRTLQRKLGKK